MKIANLLHFYQPYNQQSDILNRIVNESYRPLVKGLLDRPLAKITVNISGSLTKLLYDSDYKDVLEGLDILNKRKQIEFTDSAMYHAFLPLLPESEIERQIMLNRENNSQFFTNYNPVGFFPPEMGISDKVLRVANKLDYKWIALSELACSFVAPDADSIYKVKNRDLYAFFRNKRVSVLMLSAVVRNASDLIYETKDIHNDNYWFAVMDAETFGHHRVGHEKFFFETMDNSFFEKVTVSDLIKSDLGTVEVEVRPSTWTNEEQDFWLDKEKKVPTTAKSFILWKDPENPIHKLQWEFTEYAINEVENSKNKNSKEWKEARELLDKALASDQYWWASAKPWWSLEMIEQGAYALSRVRPGSGSDLDLGQTFYRSILDKAFEWQRSGYVRKKHLENSSTYMKKPFKERAPAEWYNQIVLEFEDEMEKAAKQRDFEKAVKWRDALIKLKNGTDIYDVLHVVDELWSARNIPSVKPFLQHRPEEISDFAREYITK